MGHDTHGETVEVVINNRHGGFGLSTEAVEWLREHDYAAGDRCKLPGEEYDDGSGVVDSFIGPVAPIDDDSFRAAEGVVEAVKELGSDANGDHASLEIVEVPEGVDWTIEEYDGAEWVAEEHRTWR